MPSNMLSIITQNNQCLVKATELYDFLQLNKAVYSRWYTTNIVENPFAEEGKDHSTYVLNGNQGGRARREFLLTPSFAKKLCMVSKSAKAEQIRNWLVSLSEARENKELLTVKEFVWINNFLQTYKFLDNQSDIEKQSIEKLATEHGNNFGKANNIRNNDTSCSKDQVDKEFQDWLVNHPTYLPRTMNRRQKLFYCNKFKLIANAVYDFWNKNNLPETKNWINIITKVAEEMDISLYPTNEDDLFRAEQKILSQETLQLEILKNQTPTLRL